MSLTHLHKPVLELKGFSLYYSTDNVAVIAMNRGENRLNNAFMQDYNTLLDHVEKNESCRGLVTTGVGKFFSNGIDLIWIAKQEKMEVRRFFSNIWSLLRRLILFPLPSVAAINGHCFAGGAFLALAHDTRIMRDDGRGWFCFNEVHGGMQFAKPMLVFLRAKVGMGTTLHDALALGHRFTAPEAQLARLVHSQSSEVMLVKEAARAIKRAHLSTGIPRSSLTNMKADLYEDLIACFDKEILRFEKKVDDDAKDQSGVVKGLVLKEEPALETLSKRLKSSL